MWLIFYPPSKAPFAVANDTTHIYAQLNRTLRCGIPPSSKSAVNCFRTLQRVPNAHPQPGHLRGVHHADHSWKHLSVGHSQRSPQTRHVAPQLLAQIRQRLHLVHFRVRKVRVCVRACKYFMPAVVLRVIEMLAVGVEKLSFGKVIKTSTKQLRISETSQDISICHRALQATMWQVPLWACVCVCVLYLLTHVFMCLTPAGYYSVSLSVTEQSAMDICRSAIWEWARSKWVSVCVFLAQDVWHRRGFVHVPDAGGGDDLPAGPLGHAGHCPAAWEDDGGDGEELPGTFVLFFFSLSSVVYLISTSHTW